MRLTSAQRMALMSANKATGDIIDSFEDRIRISTARAMKAKGLVTMEEWSTSGNAFGARGRGWSAKLTDLGWQWWTVGLCLEHHLDIALSDVVMLDGEPTLDGMTPEDWLEAMTME